MTFSESWNKWNVQHEEDMAKGVPGANALFYLTGTLLFLLLVSAVGGFIWLCVILIMNFHWAFLWWLAGGIFTIWAGFALMYIFSSITRLKEPK